MTLKEAQIAFAASEAAESEAPQYDFDNAMKDAEKLAEVGRKIAAFGAQIKQDLSGIDYGWDMGAQSIEQIYEDLIVNAADTIWHGLSDQAMAVIHAAIEKSK